SSRHAASSRHDGHSTAVQDVALLRDGERNATPLAHSRRLGRSGGGSVALVAHAGKAGSADVTTGRFTDGAVLRPATAAIVRPTISDEMSSRPSCLTTSDPGHGCSAYQSTRCGS